MPLPMSKVMVFGTFDLLHRGHVHFLKKAKRYGTLIAVVARDRIVRKLKKKPPVFSERKRASLVRSLGIAAKVVLGDRDYSLNVLKKYKPDVVCLGYDQHEFKSFLAGKTSAKIVMLKPFKPHIYKSSLLRKKL